MTNKILTVLICLLLITTPSFSALDFTNNTTDRVDAGSDTSLDDITDVTILLWAWVDTGWSGNTFLYSKGSGGNRRLFWLDSSNNNLGGEVINMNGRKIKMFANIANLSAFGVDKWMYIAFRYKASDTVASDQRIYVGDLSTLAAEPSSYADQSNNAQGTASDGSTNLLIGNDQGTSANWDGKIAYVSVFNTALSTAQIQAQQFNPRNTADCVLFYYLGFNGTGTQPDWSGNGNNGTVTGATVSDNVPIKAPFGG